MDQSEQALQPSSRPACEFLILGKQGQSYLVNGQCTNQSKPCSHHPDQHLDLMMPEESGHSKYDSYHVLVMQCGSWEGHSRQLPDPAWQVGFADPLQVLASWGWGGDEVHQARA